MYASNAEYLTEQLEKYVGWTVEAVFSSASPETADEEPNVVLCLSKGTDIVGLHVLCDEEGNGPGWIDIVEGTMADLLDPR